LAFLFVFTGLIIGRNTYKFQSPISSITYTGQDIEFVEYWISLRGWDGCFGSQAAAHDLSTWAAGFGQKRTAKIRAHNKS
jgi:hypothetical protein